MSGHGPPGKQTRPDGGASDRLLAGGFGTPTIDDAAPYVPDPTAGWFALFDAECVVQLEALALEALRDLTTEKLRSLRWVGLLDNGWRRMTYVLSLRGESL